MGGTREVGGGNGVDGWSLIGGSGWGLWMRWNADSMIKWWFGCYCDCVVSLGLVELGWWIWDLSLSQPTAGGGIKLSEAGRPARAQSDK